jgi:hypothetical protein
MPEMKQRRWGFNRTILAVSLLLCVALAVVGAYLLGMLDRLH